LIGILAALFAVAGARAQASLDMRWDLGAEDCTPDQHRTQAHAIDETTIVIRQNPCVDFEAPLMYLLLGTERALMLDSGASDDPAVTGALTSMVSEYLVRPDGARLPLVVAHTHRHQDHRAGDAAFAALPSTTVVPHEGERMREFFGFRTWPNEEVRFDLGGREIVLLPTPGHQADHVVFLDSRTRLLFTGDFYLPGRLLVEDIDAYRSSAMNLVEFVQVWGVKQALGAHIEMNTAGELYSAGATHHPHERQLALPFGIQQSVELHGALEDFNGFYNRHTDYAISNPLRNLIALATAVIAALALGVWMARRLWKRRRASS
jgi:glyoxylase-like metal-dependent hydrolase (beta-lactamase superfamily II)